MSETKSLVTASSQWTVSELEGNWLRSHRGEQSSHTSTHCCLSVSTSPQSLTLLFGGNQWKSRKHNEVRSSTEEAISHILLMPSNYQSSTSTACHHHYWFSSASSLLPFPWSLYGPLVVRTESVTQWQATGCNGIKRVVKYTHTHTWSWRSREVQRHSFSLSFSLAPLYVSPSSSIDTNLISK